ncbi:ATP-binding protein [Anaerofustis stercorihominis]|uniref:ATP-binding protein n=1 Tax=Anaerofustis stercorihominis TaxID=214853 RepID=UPI00214CD0AF|nr:4Fe-4S dicluster domain-containing protein [Anaerofustis stercorihominis]MCR2033675.1 4Fe-4S binding protein [Anaerofustis stercorihominis]
MKRRIIKIDEDKCNGCELCVNACHEGAIGMVDGKARLLRDDYCDGLGDCLPTCPTGAISFEEREALEYDEEAVKKNMMKKQQGEKLPCGCAGSNSKKIVRNINNISNTSNNAESMLTQWPVQIKLAPVNAPYFDNAKLLIAADCSAYAYGNFHSDFIKDHITLIGCPKLDSVDYSEKLYEIINQNKIRSITLTRMEVPCCGGIEHALKEALKKSGKFVPWNIVTISTDGRIIERL